MSSAATEAPEASTQWGLNIIIAGTLGELQALKEKASWQICTALRWMEIWVESLVTSGPTGDLKLNRYFHKFTYPRGVGPWGVPG